MYVKLTRALDVLTNDDKRHVYDHGGNDDLERFEIEGQYNGRTRVGPSARADINVSLEELYKGV